MLSKKDKELIEAASSAVKSRYRNDWQEVGAAMRTRDGRIIDVSATVALLFDAAGNPESLAATERDITARRRAEDETRGCAGCADDRLARERFMRDRRIKRRDRQHHANRHEQDRAQRNHGPDEAVTACADDHGQVHHVRPRQHLA